LPLGAKDEKRRKDKIMFSFQKKNVPSLPDELKRKLVTITDFLATMPPGSRSEFINEFIAKKVGEAIGEHYKKMIEMESEEVQAALRTQLSIKQAQQANEAIPQVMRIIKNALEEIDEIYQSGKFKPGSPTEQIWKMVLVAAEMRVVNASLQAYDGMGIAFNDAVDIIQIMMDGYKQKFLPPSQQKPTTIDESDT
jgi:hypothetical protein